MLSFVKLWMLLTVKRHYIKTQCLNIQNNVTFIQQFMALIINKC
jgi:hypothetical protein